MIKQVSIFLENKEGRLRDVLKILSVNKIDIRALTIAETSDYGVLRLIVDDSIRATRILKQNDFRVNETNVLTIEVVDSSGSLHGLISLFCEYGINVEYSYTGTALNDGNALFVIRVSDAQQEKAVELLKQREDIKLLESPTK